MENRYLNFIPTRPVLALKKAVLQLYCNEDFTVSGKLGSGYFADVYLVYHRPTRCYMAMKISTNGKLQRREIEYLSSLQHNNILRLYGACIVSGRLACITEYANGGSLVDLLKATSTPLPWETRIKLALDIAYGLRHLHQHHLIHRDLSSQNVLIRVIRASTSDFDYLSSEIGCPEVRADAGRSSSCGLPSLCIERSRGEMSDPLALSASIRLPKIFPLVSDLGATSLPTGAKFESRYDGRHEEAYTAVIGDLGLCLDLTRPDATSAPTVGNPFYNAPERLSGLSPYASYTDIFSYGLLVCEIITRLFNDGSLIPRTKTFGLDVANLPVSSACPTWLIDLAAACCDLDFNRRPSIDDVILQLSAHQHCESRTEALPEVPIYSEVTIPSSGHTESPSCVDMLSSKVSAMVVRDAQAVNINTCL